RGESHERLCARPVATAHFLCAVHVLPHLFFPEAKIISVGRGPVLLRYYFQSALCNPLLWGPCEPLSHFGLGGHLHLYDDDHGTDHADAATARDAQHE